MTIMTSTFIFRVMATIAVVRWTEAWLFGPSEHEKFMEKRKSEQHHEIEKEKTILESQKTLLEIIKQNTSLQQRIVDSDAKTRLAELDTKKYEAAARVSVAKENTEQEKLKKEQRALELEIQKEVSRVRAEEEKTKQAEELTKQKEEETKREKLLNERTICEQKRKEDEQKHEFDIAVIIAIAICFIVAIIAFTFLIFLCLNQRTNQRDHRDNNERFDTQRDAPDTQGNTDYEEPSSTNSEGDDIESSSISPIAETGIAAKSQLTLTRRRSEHAEAE